MMALGLVPEWRCKMLHVTTAELRKDTEALIRKVNSDNEPILVSENQKVLAVIMPVTAESFEDELEDTIDLEAARRSLAEQGEDLTLAEYEKRMKLTDGL